MKHKVRDLIPFNHIWRSDQEIGIEIEMEGSHLEFNRSKLWEYVYDGSLRGNPEAIEYVLKQPIALKETKSAIDGLEKLLLLRRKAIFKPSDRCGVHIHFNVQNYTLQQLLNFICTYLIIENLLIKYCGNAREGNMFCLRAGDAEHLIDCIINFRRFSDISYLYQRQGDLRYAAMNVSSVRRHGSLEFRALRTPDKLIHIEKWIELLTLVKVAALKFNDPIEIIENFSQLGGVGFSRSIFKNKFKLLTKDVDVNMLLLQGIRLVQDIAYVEIEKVKEKSISNVHRERIVEVERLVEERRIWRGIPTRPRVPPPEEAPDPEQPRDAQPFPPDINQVNVVLEEPLAEEAADEEGNFQ